MFPRARNTQAELMGHRGILLLEDDPIIGATLRDCLGESGYKVQWSKNLQQAYEAVRTGSFDLCLLDLNLPDGVSYDFCREIRAENPSLPIIFLTANVNEESAVKGLSVGATDFLRKPIGRRELLLRIKRCLANKSGKIVLGALSLDIDNRIARLGEEVIPFTQSEFRLLVLLAEKKGELVSRETLMRGIDSEGDISDAALSNHLGGIRTKLKKAGDKSLSIVSVYGEGYRLVQADGNSLVSKFFWLSLALAAFVVLTVLARRAFETPGKTQYPPQDNRFMDGG